MPLPKRCVEPVHVSRGTVPERLAVPSELEAVTNGTLANTVRQLSSLSKHAEDMFGELTREATGLAERTNVLQARIDRLAIKVTQLDSGVEEVSLQDIQMRKAFRSSRAFQQQLFSRNSMPSAMLATYARCDRPPPLERLNEFRDDGRDARKFYTDPDYFFELWRREMLQDTERIQHDRGKKQLFSRNSMPSAMLATYARCDRPPPLERLNEFRDDGRDARKFYTDPDYFFELWRREMLQDTERIQHDRGKKVRAPRSGSGEDRRGARRVRAPHSTRERQRAAAVRGGEHIMAPSQLKHYELEQHNKPDPIYIYTSVPDGNYKTPQNRPPSTQAARPNSIEIDKQQNRQPKLTGNGHVGEESPYGSVTEPIYGGSQAGTPRRPRPSMPPPAPPAHPAPPQHPQHPQHPGHVQHAQHAQHQPAPPRPETPPDNNLTPTRSSLPPPPPPPDSSSPPPMMNGASPPHRTALDQHLDHMHAVIGMMSGEAVPSSPPPPPPAPPRPPRRPRRPRPRPTPRARAPSPGALLRGASALKPPRPAADPQPDPRSDLLKAIRDGIKLRKVEKRCDDTTGRYDTLRGAPAFHDVASILARRVAVELSDTSSGADSDSDDSDQWTTESRA